MSHTVTVERDGTGWRVGSLGECDAELLTAEEARDAGWAVLTAVGIGDVGESRVRVKVVYDSDWVCVLVLGRAVMSAEDARAVGLALIEAADEAGKWVKPELGAWGRVKKPQGMSK